MASWRISERRPAIQARLALARVQGDFGFLVVERLSYARTGCTPSTGAFFLEESKKRGDWLASDAGDFANHLAIFYTALLQAPNVPLEDLGGWLKDYKVELLTWFQV